jgi:hypothetical protein
MFQTGGLIWGISWIWYLVGALGVGGTIAFFAIDAVAAMAVFKGLLRFLWRTRPGWAIVALAIAIPLTDIHRSRSDQAAMEAATAAFEQKQHERDKQIAADTRKAVDEALAVQAVNDAATDKRAEDFTHELPPIPATGNPFTVGPDACRLRQIAGLSCRGLEGTPVPMPKAHPKHRRATDRP